jgi:predicted TIM-barrel fold metal-dependent hydrolase
VRTAEGFSGRQYLFRHFRCCDPAADSPLEAEFVWTLRNAGIDHVLLGSDYPQMTLGKTVDALERLDLRVEEKARIGSGNARRLFGR